MPETTIVKTIRIPEEWEKKLEAESRRLGLSFNKLVTVALASRYGLGGGALPDLLVEVATLLRQSHGNGQPFSHDVTMTIFQRIKTSPRLAARYQEAIDARGAGVVNRAIGRCVRNTLDAEVYGRATLPNNDGLSNIPIKSYSLLRPRA